MTRWWLRVPSRSKTVEQGVTVGRVGERALLKMIAERVPPLAPELGAGDDAAVLEGSPGPLLMTVDTLVEGVDFDLSYASGFDIGWKAVAINASDIAAMGGRPAHALAALSLRPDVPVAFFEDLLEGILESAERTGAKLAGGDLSGASEVTLSLTMTGSSIHRPVLRSGARPGDAICVTGAFGGSAGGLFVLKNGLEDHTEASALIDRHLRPRPRVREGGIIAEHGATAMIDVSDGLAIDLLRLMEAGAVGCDVRSDSVPVDPALRWLMSAADAPDVKELALTGGEDYELMFALPEERFDRVEQQLVDAGTSLTRIGTVTDGAPELDGEPLIARKELGWDHLQSP